MTANPSSPKSRTHIPAHLLSPFWHDRRFNFVFAAAPTPAFVG